MGVWLAATTNTQKKKPHTHTHENKKWERKRKNRTKGEKQTKVGQRMARCVIFPPPFFCANSLASKRRLLLIFISAPATQRNKQHTKAVGKKRLTQHTNNNSTQGWRVAELFASLNLCLPLLTSLAHSRLHCSSSLSPSPTFSFFWLLCLCGNNDVERRVFMTIATVMDHTSNPEPAQTGPMVEGDKQPANVPSASNTADADGGAQASNTSQQQRQQQTAAAAASSSSSSSSTMTTTASANTANTNDSTQQQREEDQGQQKREDQGQEHANAGTADGAAAATATATALSAHAQPDSNGTAAASNHAETEADEDEDEEQHEASSSTTAAGLAGVKSEPDDLISEPARSSVFSSEAPSPSPATPSSSSFTAAPNHTQQRTQGRFTNQLKYLQDVVMKRLASVDAGGWFAKPVDWKTLNLPVSCTHPTTRAFARLHSCMHLSFGFLL